MKNCKLFILGLALIVLLAALNSCASRVKLEIKFMVDDEVYAVVNTASDKEISVPQDPVKEGKSFNGWYWDKDIWQKPFTANSLADAPLSSNMVVYAKWSEERAADDTAPDNFADSSTEAVIPSKGENKGTITYTVDEGGDEGGNVNAGDWNTPIEGFTTRG